MAAVDLPYTHCFGHTYTLMQLRYINDQWDKDYREHQEVFRRFREDSHRAQSENESFIAVLKESKEQLLDQIRDLQYELDRSRKEVQRIQQQQLAGHQNGISPRRLKELEEENAFLRSQVGSTLVCILMFVLVITLTQ